MPPPLKSVTRITAAPAACRAGPREARPCHAALSAGSQPDYTGPALGAAGAAAHAPGATARVPVHSRSPPFTASGLPPSTPRLALTTVPSSCAWHPVVVLEMSVQWPWAKGFAPQSLRSATVLTASGCRGHGRHEKALWGRGRRRGEGRAADATPTTLGHWLWVPRAPGSPSLPTPKQPSRRPPPAPAPALPGQDLQVLQRRQQPLSRAVAAGRPRPAARPLLLLFAHGGRRHAAPGPRRLLRFCAGADVGSAAKGSGRGGEAGPERPLWAWGCAAGPAPSAGPERASGFQP